MTIKARLARLEQAHPRTMHEGSTEMVRTDGEKRIGMIVWLHCHQITHAQIDSDAALAHARHLHQTPIVLPSFYTPMPADVQNELDAHRDEVLKSHAALSEAERAELNASTRRQEALAASFLAEAAGIH